MDEQTYLEPGFDPSSLTMPRLRSILVAHGVEYPASSKKPQLVEIFNENVLPQAKKLRAASARVKRTSRGIVDMPSQNSSQADEEEDDEQQEPIRTAPRSTRRTTRSRTEEAEEVAPTPRSVRHSTAPPERATPARRVSSKHARTYEPEVVEEEIEPEPKRPASRKSRASVATPVAAHRDETSPFSDQNVFQSGGSPPAPSTDRRRTTFGVPKSTERQRSRDARRRTDEHRPVREQLGGAAVPSRRTFEMPISRMPKQEIRDEVVADEEFTPEEQQALVNAQTAGELVPARRKTKPAASNAAKMGPAALLTALLAGFATLYRQEKLQVGYCGVGHPSREIAGTQIPDWADAARPQCEPCPPHAFCHENLYTECEPGFVLTPHPFSINGIVPLPPTCEPDSARARKVEAVKQRAVEELREHNARYECGDTPKKEVKESELKQAIATKRNKRMTNEEFEDLWNSALPEIQNVDEVVSGSDGLALPAVSQASPSAPPPSPASPSPAQSEDPYAQRLDSIFGNL